VGSVSFSSRCVQCRCSRQRTAHWRRGHTVARKAAGGRCGSAAARPGVLVRRSQHARTRAYLRKPMLNPERGRTCASRRASAGCQRGRCNGRAVRAALLDDAPVAEPAMRAACQLDTSHAAHEGLCVFARLRVGQWHRQQLARQCQARGLGCRRQQPVVADALEARWQYMLQQSADELLTRHGDDALAARGVGAHALSTPDHISPFSPE